MKKILKLATIVVVFLISLTAFKKAAGLVGKLRKKRATVKTA